MEDNIKYIHKKEIHNTSAAEIILSIVFQKFDFKSIIDIGCGTGTWLQAAQKLGINDIQGLDGEYVNPEELLIDKKFFFSTDLSFEFDLKRKFDLALSLEVAEHLPFTSSNGFIKSITNHSEIVVFSAAIPNQGGQNHINEQEPSFWVNIFNSFGYDCYDIFRPILWNKPSIDWWYKQNMFIAIKRNNRILENDVFNTIRPNYVPCLIHPELYNYRVNMILNLRKHFSLNKSDQFDGIKPQIMQNIFLKFFCKYFYKLVH